MKKIGFIICVFFFGYTHAQNLTIAPDTSIGVEEGTDIWVAHATLQNDGASVAQVNWVRTTNEFTEGWYTAICDFTYCYSPGTDEAPSLIVMNPGSSGDVKVNFYTNGLAGTGYVEIKYWSITDSAAYNAIGVFIADRLTSGFYTPINDHNYAVYPNPANQEMQVLASFSSNIETIHVVNIVGKKMESVDWNSTTGIMTLNVNDLPEGMYFIQYINDHSEIVATKKFAVKH